MASAINDLGLGVDHNAAHGVMYAHACIARVKRCTFNFSQHLRSLAECIPLSVDAGVKVIDRLLKNCGIYLHFRCELFDRVGFPGVSGFKSFKDARLMTGIRLIKTVLVNDRKGGLLWQ